MASVKKSIFLLVCDKNSIEAVSAPVFGPVLNLEPFFSVSTDKERALGQERVVQEWQTACVWCWGGGGVSVTALKKKSMKC